jgi:hypothetical protein
MKRDMYDNNVIREAWEITKPNFRAARKRAHVQVLELVTTPDNRQCRAWIDPSDTDLRFRWARELQLVTGEEPSGNYSVPWQLTESRVKLAMQLRDVRRLQATIDEAQEIAQVKALTDVNTREMIEGSIDVQKSCDFTSDEPRMLTKDDEAELIREETQERYNQFCDMIEIYETNERKKAAKEICEKELGTKAPKGLTLDDLKMAYTYKSWPMKNGVQS